MNKITRIKIFTLITLGITFTLFPIIHNNLNFNIGNSNKSLVNSDDTSFKKKI